MRCFFPTVLLTLSAPALAADLRLGLVGRATGHVLEFTKILHDQAG